MTTAEAQFADKKILVVEDENFLSLALVSTLKRYGFPNVDRVKNGEDAVYYIEHHQPDLVLLDLMMPIKNGFDVLKDVKADPKLKATPIIVLSSLASPEDQAECMRLGALDFKVKSDTMLHQIVETVRNYFQAH